MFCGSSSRFRGLSAVCNCGIPGQPRLFFFSLKSDCLSAPKIAIGVENDMSQIFLKVCVFFAYGH